MDSLEKIYSETSEELGISKASVRTAAESQFSFVAKTMREKEFTDVRLRFLGIFKVKPGRLKHLTEESKQNIKNKTHEFDKFL